MKTVNYIILLGIVLLSSCIVEENSRPPKTLMAKNVANEASLSIISAIQYSDISIKANSWLSAPSVADKNKLEDLYFPNHKVRMSGDTIIIVDLCKIMTYGKKLHENRWSYMDWIAQDTASISNPSSNKYSITVSNKRHSFDLSLTSKDKSYLISGSGKRQLRMYGEVTYQISEEIVVGNITEQFYTGQYEIYNHFIGGVNSFKWYSTPDAGPENIQVKYAPESKMTIVAFGHTDNYNGYW